MIPYAELDRALKRWNARKAGGAGEEPVSEVTADAVVSETDAGHAHFESASGLIQVEFDRDDYGK
jgi:hypothetical protein